MSGFKRTDAFAGALGAVLTLLLAACGSSTSVSTSLSGEPVVSGRVVLESEAPVAVTQGSHYDAVLRLSGSAGVVGQQVALAASDSLVAEVSPSTCSLSSASEASSQCVVRIFGKAAGSTTVRATASGYADTGVAVNVGASLVYGSLAVANASGRPVSISPVALTYPRSGSAGPYTLPLSAELRGTSGIVGDAAAINYTIDPPTPGVTLPGGVTSYQCAVTTVEPQCDATLTFAAAVPAKVVVRVVGAIIAGHTYSPITIDATPAEPPAPGGSNGTIRVLTQSGNKVWNGLKAPLYVNWAPVASDTVKLTLTIDGAGVSFYDYVVTQPASGSPVTTYTTSTTKDCSLTAGSTGCGFGLVGSATSGAVTVSAKITSSANNYKYAIDSLTLGLGDPTTQTPRRTVRFENNSTVQDLWVGIAGGAASSYLGPNRSVVPPGTPSADVKPGAGSQCGLTNPAAACPIGSTCAPGGATPGLKTPYYCYYDTPPLQPGFQVDKNGGSTTFSIPGPSIAPNNVIWSGNFFGRTGCAVDANGIFTCVNAGCSSATSGQACAIGAGGSPGVNTLAELTFQASPSPDFYDVSIINGVNFAVEFGPSTLPASQSTLYQCGTAGSRSNQWGGFGAGGLAAAPWSMNPSAPASFPAGAALTGEAASYYRVVVPSSATPQACTSSAAIPAAGGCAGLVDSHCGWRLSDLSSGTFAFNQRYCGQPVAWTTADSIWGANSTSTNQAPFGFQTSFPNGNGGTVSVGDLQKCINGTYSAYLATSQPSALACGGVMWGNSQSSPPRDNPGTNVGQSLTTPNPSQPVQTANANWLSYVLPTLLWLKTACPTCYTYPFDDMSSTFTCSVPTNTAYKVSFGDVNF
jgi:hypothetical protein